MIVYIFDNYGGIWELTDVFIKNTKNVFIKNTKKVPVELMAYNIYIKRSITPHI